MEDEGCCGSSPLKEIWTVAGLLSCVSPSKFPLRDDLNVDIGACSCRSFAWLGEMLYEVLCAKHALCLFLICLLMALVLFFCLEE